MCQFLSKVIILTQFHTAAHVPAPSSRPHCFLRCSTARRRTRLGASPSFACGPRELAMWRSTQHNNQYLLTCHRYNRLEICIGMICGSIPCVKPLYTRLRYGKARATSTSAGSYQLSDRAVFANKARTQNTIYRSQEIEFSSGPAVSPRPESEDSILPRTIPT